MQVSFINEKVFYRFVEFTSRYINYNLSHEDYKLIALNKKEANSSIEKKVRRLADAFLFVINQTSQIIDSEMLESIYYLLTKNKLNKIIIEKLLLSYYSDKDEQVHFRSAKMFMIINQMFFKQKFEFSMLISNLILLKENYFPIIFQEGDKKYIENLLENNNLEDLHKYIYIHEHQTRNGIGLKENIGRKISVNELSNIINENKEKLENKYRVKHIFIYGGMAKNILNNSSDIDLLVDLKDELAVFEKYEAIKVIKNYLESILKSKVDVLDFRYSIKYSEIKEINNTKKIF